MAATSTSSKTPTEFTISPSRHLATPPPYLPTTVLPHRLTTPPSHRPTTPIVLQGQEAPVVIISLCRSSFDDQDSPLTGKESDATPPGVETTTASSAAAAQPLAFGELAQAPY